MKQLVAALLATLAIGAQAADLTGAGATFPYPIYSKWSEAYKAATGIGLNYQSIGSGGGIRQIKAKIVDFGASDMPLKKDELDKEGLAQFPAIIGGVVPVINIDGIGAGQLKLTAEVIANIYMGKITKWDHASIAAINPGLKLPNANITVVHRSDGSGTTFIWTNWLSKTVPEWADKVKDGTAVKWPVGTGGKGNEGVSAIVQQLKNSIGYVEYAYAKVHLDMLSMHTPSVTRFLTHRSRIVTATLYSPATIHSRPRLPTQTGPMLLVSIYCSQIKKARMLGQSQVPVSFSCTSNRQTH